jgi:hypothetical protein
MESRLINSGEVVAVYKIDKYPMNIEGRIYQVAGIDDNGNLLFPEFFAEACVKWDNCSHFNFYGQDYEKDNEADSYYHICGSENYILFSSILYFAIITMYMINDETRTFYDYEADVDIMKDTLNKLGYSIELIWDN